MPTADYTIVLNDRLAAYLYRGEGTIRRAQAQMDLEQSLGALPYADLIIYDSAQQSKLVTLANKANDVTGLLVALGIEGFRIYPGELHPNATTRLF